MKTKQITLAVALICAGITSASAAQFNFTAGPSFGRLDGLGFHNQAIAGVSISGSAIFSGGLGLHAALTSLGTRGRGWADANIGALYSIPVSDRLVLAPVFEAGQSGFTGGGAKADYTAAGIGAGYALTPSLAVAGQVLHGQTFGVQAAGGRLPGGQYQSASLALIGQAPFGLPGDVSVAYSRTRFYVDSLPFGGDQYLRTDLLSLAYSQTF